MAGLPRRIIKVTAQANPRLCVLLFAARRTGRRSFSLPRTRGPRWEARGQRGEGLAVAAREVRRWGGGSGETSGRGRAAGRRGPGASRCPPRGRGRPGLHTGGGWGCEVAGFLSWARAGAGLRGFSDHPGGGRGRARIAAGPELRAGVVARHSPSALEPFFWPGGSAGVRKPRVQNE